MKPITRTTRRRRFEAWAPRGIAAAALAATALSLAGACRPSVEALDPQSLPEGVRADYKLFERRCSKCHSLARPLTAGITDQVQWERYVSRMRAQPASGISLEDQAAILRFLRYYSDEELRKKAARNAPAGPPSSAPPPPPPATGSQPTKGT